MPSVTVRAEPPPADAVNVTTEQFEIEYEVEAGSSPISSIELWYSRDSGVTWRKYGVDSDVASPIVFRASEEGLYSFVIVAVAPDGASSDAPDEDTTPHLRAYVDFTPPVVQLHKVVQSDPPTVPASLRISWSAIDSGLSSRPIELTYESTDDGVWHAIDGPFANTGTYDWRVPDGVPSEIRIRLTVTDRVGHRVERTSSPVRIRRPWSDLPERRRYEPDQIALSSHTGLGGGRARALELLDKGREHAMRREYRLAGSRLRDALAADPDLTDAMVELGHVLYMQRRLSESVTAFQMAAKRLPDSREVREGLAMALIGERRFGEAVRQLGYIVQADPKDVAAWLNLGDIAIYQGDEILARQHYEKAMTLDPSATDVIEQAKLRLTDLQRLAAEFRQVPR
jgi:hypothetical protein